MSQSKVQPKMSLREQLKRTQELLRTAIANANNGTFVANAMFWKLGLRNRDEIKKIVDDYMAHMTAKVEAAKEPGNVQVFDNFLQTDAAILAKVAEHADSTETDSE